MDFKTAPVPRPNGNDRSLRGRSPSPGNCVHNRAQTTVWVRHEGAELQDATADANGLVIGCPRGVDSVKFPAFCRSVPSLWIHFLYVQ